MISKYFPAWYIGRFKDKRIILSSYEADFAASWGAKSRDVLVDVGKELFDVQLSDMASSRWSLKGYDGGMNTAGVGGAITGKGADCFIIDDPVKNAEEAHSKTYQEKTLDWYRSTAYTRLEPGGAFIIIMTRWNENDLVGKITKAMTEEGETWDVVNLPAVCEDETLPEEQEMGRRNGEALWRERYDQQSLKKIKKTVGSYWFNAMYQQRPAPPEGNLFKRAWFQYFEVLHEGADDARELVFYLYGRDEVRRVLASKCWAFATVDLAASLKHAADYTAVSVFIVTERFEMLWIACARCKLEGPDQPKLMRDAFLNYQLEFMGVESAGYQLTLVQTLLREGLAIKKLKADVDKVSRALAASVKYENGMVFHRIGTEWLEDAEHELLLFPGGAHDDMVDTVSYAAIELSLYATNLVREL